MLIDDNRGIISVEILLAFFLWAIFLTGIASLWFSLFGSKIPLYSYIEDQNFLIDPEGIGTSTFTDRGIKKVEGSGGLITYLSDWNNGFGKRTCRGLNTANLKQVVTEPLTLDGANIASAMFVRGSYIFLVTNSASTTDPDFYVISIREKDNPVLISKIDTGPGLSALSVAGYVAYVANTSVNSQAQAIDVSDLLKPRVVWSFKVPGSNSSSTSLGKSITSNGASVFLGTAKSSFSELIMLSATSGQMIKGYEIGSGVNNIFSDQDKLFTLLPIDPELMIFNINLEPIAQYDAPGGSGNGKSIDIFNNDIYLGRTLGGNELVSLDTNLSSLHDARIGATIDGIISSRDFLYVLTSNSQKELQVWRKSDLTLSQTIDLPARALGIGCSGQYLYVAKGTNTPLLIFK